MIKREPPFWRACFGDNFTIALNVPWRIVVDGRIAFGNADDGQLFGLATPLDGERLAASLLKDRVLQALHLDFETGDLRIVFDGDTRIDLFNNLSSYEGCQAEYAVGRSWHSVIATGGGEMVVV